MVLDNLSAHKAAGLRPLIEQRGARSNDRRATGIVTW